MGGGVGKMRRGKVIVGEAVGCGGAGVGWGGEGDGGRREEQIW